MVKLLKTDLLCAVLMQFTAQQITLARLLHWELCSAGLMSRCNRGAAAEVDAIGEQQLKQVKQAKLLITINKIATLADHIRLASPSHMTARWFCALSTICGELDETTCSLILQCVITGNLISRWSDKPVQQWCHHSQYRRIPKHLFTMATGGQRVM